MANKRVTLRLEESEFHSLKLRSTIERRPIHEIITDAIREYVRNHPISRQDMLAMANAIAKEDASLLKTLADA